MTTEYKIEGGDAAQNQIPVVAVSASSDGASVANQPGQEQEDHIRADPCMGLAVREKKSSSGAIRIGLRDQWGDVIKKNVPSITAHHKRVALTAAEVLAALKVNDLMVQDIEHANGIGDALGVPGLRLPVIGGAGPKHYYLPAATMTVEERADFDAMSAQEKIQLIREENEAFKSVDA